ncbi:MAG: GNAT family acetyltransferase [Clostridiales bacterium]|nr:GNAT family acetyltransferase [Clostridiales bacterium]
MITTMDILCLHFYDYKSAFTGSEGNMRYRIYKAEHEKEDGEKEALLSVTVWKGPYAFDHTKEEKIVKEFPFTEEGQKEAVNWLNDEYTILG